MSTFYNFWEIEFKGLHRCQKLTSEWNDLIFFFFKYYAYILWVGVEKIAIDINKTVLEKRE